MRVKTLIRWVYRHFGRRGFQSRHILHDQYSPHPITLNAIYVAVHRCWKMGLLSRTKLTGNLYRYQITDWGVRYSEDGEYYREDEIRIKLLNYITKSDDRREKEWAEELLIPRLLKRFLPGRKAQDINPLIDLPEVIENVTLPLKNKIMAELIVQDDWFIIKYIDDLRIIFLGYTLMHQLHPTTIFSFDYESMKRKIRKMLNKYIDELSNPPKQMIHHVYLGYEGRLSPMPWTEYRPNTKDFERLEKILNKLKELKRNPLIANGVK